MLAGAHLVEYATPDRVRLHDLIRFHARELAQSQDSGEERLSARKRVAEWYLHTSDNAGRALIPGGSARSRPRPRDVTHFPYVARRKRFPDSTPRKPISPS